MKGIIILAEGKTLAGTLQKVEICILPHRWLQLQEWAAEYNLSERAMVSKATAFGRYLVSYKVFCK